MFEGKSGLPVHLLATTVNGTSGNKTFGMTSGTNGCDTSGALTYDGKSLLAMNGMLEEVAQDMAVGHGEALTALSVSMAKAVASEGFQQSCENAIYVHAGAGMDLDYGLTTHTKRSKFYGHYLGDAIRHKLRMARLLGLEPGQEPGS